MSTTNTAERSAANLSRLHVQLLLVMDLYYDNRRLHYDPSQICLREGSNTPQRPGYGNRGDTYESLQRRDANTPRPTVEPAKVYGLRRPENVVSPDGGSEIHNAAAPSPFKILFKHEHQPHPSTNTSPYLEHMPGTLTWHETPQSGPMGQQ